jgi:hypothetical protein
VRRRLARVRGDSGAAALEFALVSFVLFPLVFGMVDYGLFFTDSLGARDGVRVAARQGSVENFGGSCPSGIVAYGGDNNLDRLACTAVDETGAIGGTTYALVTPPAGWDRGKDLLVCVAVVDEGVSGIVPMPNGHTVQARLTVRIERAVTKPPSGSVTRGEATTSSNPAPIGLWDDWCL